MCAVRCIGCPKCCPCIPWCFEDIPKEGEDIQLVDYDGKSAFQTQKKVKFSFIDKTPDEIKGDKLLESAEMTVGHDDWSWNAKDEALLIKLATDKKTKSFFEKPSIELEAMLIKHFDSKCVRFHSKFCVSICLHLSLSLSLCALEGSPLFIYLQGDILGANQPDTPRISA